MSAKAILDPVTKEVRVVSLMEWAQWFEESDDIRRVARTSLPGVDVSTVFLGLDHSWNGGPPLWFETMVFGGPLDQEQVRYTTFAEAEAGHADMVEQVRAALALESGS